MQNEFYIKNINLLAAGGSGDFLLSYKLKCLLNFLYPEKYIIKNYFCSRPETFNIIKTIFPNDPDIIQLPENYLEDKKTEESLGNINNFASRNFIAYPDTLFRGHGKPTLSEWNINPLMIKQYRVLLGKNKPSGYISFALNSVTNFYTYHSIPELVTKVAKAFPDRKIFYPLLNRWAGKDVPQPNFGNLPKNVELNINPSFEKVYEILCKSDHTICTDNLIMHLCGEMFSNHLILDPQYKKPAWESRWRNNSYYNSIPIESLVDDIVDIVKIQIDSPESQMVSVENFYRKGEVNISQLLLFKE